MPGLWLDFIDKEFACPWALQISEHEHLVQITVLVSGVITYDHCYPPLEPNRSYFSGSGLSPRYVAHYGKPPQLQGINIHLEPEVIRPWLVDQAPSLQSALLSTTEWKQAWFPAVTPAMQAVVQQIRHCPLSATLRRVYWQAKVWELLALQLDAVLSAQGMLPSSCRLKASTVEALHRAQEILVAQVENPPLITTLAQQVGLSDRTLRRGFREIFGTTVISYLTQQRLLRAQQLLAQGQYTVTEVAHRVGYTHLGHFAAAFRQQFGINPSESSR